MTNVFQEKKKKYFVKVTDKTLKIELDTFNNIVMKIMKVNAVEALNIIKRNDVSVNGDIVIDSNYILKSGDIIRIEMGHYLVNSSYMAVIK